MKCFHEIDYTIYNSSVRSVLGTNTNRTISTLAMGDLHYSNLVPQEKLDSIVKYSIDKRPDYIFLGGDIIESLNEVATEEDMARLIRNRKGAPRKKEYVVKYYSLKDDSYVCMTKIDSLMTLKQAEEQAYALALDGYYGIPCRITELYEE